MYALIDEYKHYLPCSSYALLILQACCQSSHVLANNIASKGIQIHTELGEMLVHMEDGYREFLKENIFGVDTYSGSLNIARVSLDWGKNALIQSFKHDAL
jgi:hypothetical protein